MVGGTRKKIIFIRRADQLRSVTADYDPPAESAQGNESTETERAGGAAE